MRRPGVVAAGMTVAMIAAGAAGAQADGPPGAAPSRGPSAWAGWERLGAGLSRDPSWLATDGTSIAVAGPTDLAVAGPGGTTIADHEGSGLGDSGGQRQPSLVWLPSGRLLASGGCSVRRSDDRGAGWTRTPLPDCPANTYATDLVVAPGAVFVSSGARTWRSTDGGASWELRGTGGPGPRAATSADVAFRVVTDVATPSAEDDLGTLQRTDDGGATWHALPLPMVTGTGSTTVQAGRTDARLVLTTRADGALLVGAGRTLLVSRDDGATFTARDVPAVASASFAIDRILCDPAGACVVSGRGGGAFLFRDDAFAGLVRGLPDLQAVSPAPGVIVGLAYSFGDDYKSGPITYAAVRTDDLGVTSYRPADEWYGGDVRLRDDGLQVSRRAEGVRISTDRGATFGAPGIPDDPDLLHFGRAPGGLVALTVAGSLRRFSGSAWRPLADLAAIDPQRVLPVSGGFLVAGRGGLRRVSDAGRVQTVPDPRRGRGTVYLDLAGAGRTLVMWGRYEPPPDAKPDAEPTPFAQRSTDGGRHWSAVSSLAGYTDLRFFSGRVGIGLRGERVYRTTDGGGTFRKVGSIPILDVRPFVTDSDEAPPGIDRVQFTDSRHATAATTSGLLSTDDGGRTWRPLPAPGGDDAYDALLTGSVLTVGDRAAGGLLRSSVASWRPTPAVTLAQRGRARDGALRNLRVSGRVRGAPAGATVVLSRTTAYGSTKGVVRVRTGADGRFAATLRVSRSSRSVRAWYLGVVARDATVPGASSRVVPIRVAR